MPALLAMLLLGGGHLEEAAATPAQPGFNEVAARGPSLAPVTVELSPFWEVLEMQVCPKLTAAGARPGPLPADLAAELQRYCAAPAGSKPPLTIAGRSDREQVLKAILENKSLAALVDGPEGAAPTGPDSSSAARAAGGSASALATSMIDTALRGLAQFLVKRAELELRTYAIGKLRKIAQCAQDTVRHRLLADTCAFLGGGEGTLMDSFGPGLRMALARDLTALPARIVREAPAEGGASQLVARGALEAGAILVADPEPMQLVTRLEVVAHKDGAEAFRCLDDPRRPEEKRSCQEAKAVLFFGAAIAREVLTDSLEIRLSGDNLLERLRAQLGRVVAAIEPSTQLHQDLSQLLKGLSDADAMARWKQLTLQLRDDAEAVIGSFREARRALKLPPEATPEQMVKAAARSVRHALRGVDQSLALADCLERIAGKLAPVRCVGSRYRIPPRLGDLLDATAQGDVAAMMAAGLDLARGALEQARFEAYISPDMARLLSFGAALASAKKPEEAEAAIEAVAMPPGGWKEKRQRSFASITGMVGLSGGLERVPGETGDAAWSSSLLGAVGLDYNRNIQGCSWTYGVFVSAIDLGGLLNVRLNETHERDTADGQEQQKVASTSPVGLAQVFAPGVALRVGLGDSPLVAMLGAQVVPNGRSVTRDQGTVELADDTTESRSVYRVMLSIAIDVTLWSF